MTYEDVDMERRIINVNHQILYDADNGYYVSEPKTKNGDRQIPMSETVYDAFSRVIENRRPSSYEIEYKGKILTNFIFCKQNGEPLTSCCYGTVFKRSRQRFKKYSDVGLPKAMSAHTLRHTFCTKMANAGMNPKSLQYLMGHANITMTLNYYAHATYESTKDEFDRITGTKPITNLPKRAVKYISA